MSRLLVGCDGGGTKTIAELAVLHDTGRIETRGEGVAGPGNVLCECSESALQNVKSAIHAAFQIAGLETRPVDALVLSLAGAGRESERAVVRDWMAGRHLARRTEIIPDSLAVLEAGSRHGRGVALIAGTGSIAVARTPAGGTVRAGGGGPLLGDEGSGYWIGLQALRAVVRKLADDSSRSPLVAQVLQRLNLTNQDQLISKVYAPDTDRSCIAQVAKDVFDTAECDVLSSAIVEQAAMHLADLVMQSACRANLVDQAFSLAMAGGILVHQPSLRRRVCSICEQRGIQLEQTNVVDRPVQGALLLAKKLLETPHGGVDHNSG